MFEKDANRVLRKLQRTLDRESNMPSLLAAATVLEELLKQVSDDNVRYQVTMKLIQVVLNSSGFTTIASDQSVQRLEELASISDNALLTVTVLGKIKGMGDLCLDHWERNRKSRDIGSLNNTYKINRALAAPAMGKLGRKFDDTDLKGMFDVFVELTTDMTDSITDDDQRNQFAFAVLRRLFPPLPGRKDDLDEMKIALHVIKDITDPEIRNRAIIILFRMVLNFSDAELRGVESNPWVAQESR